MERVVAFGLAENFINKLADHIDQNFIKQGKDISRLAMVFGGKRPSLFLKKALVERIGKSFFSPAFFSMDEFVDNLLNKIGVFSPISDLDASYIIYRLADELYPSITKGKKSFSRFLPWSQEILSFIEQLDLEAISAESLDIVRLSAKIGYDVPAGINMLLKHIISLRKEYHKKLEEKKSLTKGLRFLKVADSISKINLDEYDNILFCNFFYLNKTEKAIIKNIYDSGKGILLFQGDQKDWPVLGGVANDLNIKITPDSSPSPDFKLQIRSGFDVHSQACIVREELKNFEKTDKTVIVLPSEETLIPLISEISSDINECNISMGYPLKRSSLYSLFESIFKAQETKKGDKYYTKDYLRAIRHPIAKNFKFLDEPSITRVLVHKIEECLLGIEETSLSGSIFIDLKEIEVHKDLPSLTTDTLNNMGIDVDAKDIAAIVPKLHELLFYDWEKMDNFHGLSEVLDKFILRIIKGGFSSQYPLNIKVAQRILDIKDEFSSSDFCREIFPREELYRVFMDKLSSEKFRFSGSPLQGLQVLGMLETRSLSFENVMIMDVNDSVLPNIGIYQPLIPRDVMISLGLSMQDKKEEIERYHFMGLMSASKNAVLTYIDDGKTERSRFLEELIWRKQKENKNMDAQLVKGATFAPPSVSAKIKIEKTKDIINFLNNYSYSASSLRSYLYCPLQFYYQSVLGLEEKAELADDPEAKDVGDFLHRLLQNGFEKYKNKKPVINAQFIKYIHDGFNKMFDDELKNKMRTDSFLLREVINYRLDLFLEAEKERSKNIEKILCLEDRFKDKLDADGQIFNFNGKIDRIDRFGGGDGLIIDYKSGGIEKMPSKDLADMDIDLSRKFIKKYVRSFQLPIYIHFAAKDYDINNVNAALYYIRDMKIQKFCEDLDEAGRNKVQDICMKCIKAILKEIIDLNVPFESDDSDSQTCLWCNFHNLCR